MTNVKCVKNNRQDKKWLNSTAIERWKNFYILPGTENLSSFLSVFQTSCFLSWQVSENVLVIRALFKASSIAANVKNLFLSLAFSDLGVGLVSQLMAGIIYAVILKTASKEDYNLTSLCPTVLNLNCYDWFFLCTASLLTVTTIAFDRLLAVSLHLRYQQLVTSKRVTIVTTVANVRIYKVVKYHQNQIYGQNQLQNAKTREVLRQRKSAYNALFVYFVFLVCYFPFLPSTILYWTNTFLKFRFS